GPGGVHAVRAERSDPAGRLRRFSPPRRHRLGGATPAGRPSLIAGPAAQAGWWPSRPRAPHGDARFMAEEGSRESAGEPVAVATGTPVTSVDQEPVGVGVTEAPDRPAGSRSRARRGLTR